MSKALILTDGKAGHENQSKAFARALGCEFDLVPVAFKSKFAKTFSYLLDNLGIHTPRLFTYQLPTHHRHRLGHVLCRQDARPTARHSLRRSAVSARLSHFDL